MASQFETAPGTRTGEDREQPHRSEAPEPPRGDAPLRQRFEQKAELAVRAGFGAWALRGVELEAYLAEGWTIDDVRRLNEAQGLTVSESGSLMQWQFTGGVPLLNAFQRPPGEGAGPVREIVSRVRDKGYAGDFVVEVLSQTLWREDPLAVGQRCHAGAMKVLAAA